MLITPASAIRELDRRINDGIEVRLLWNSQTDCVSVTVEDARREEFFELQVDAADALLAFHHPFAYARREHASEALAA